MVHVSVDPARILNRISPAMFGACLEDVNHEVYGGFYAQRIYGESFEEPVPGTSPEGWQELGGEWTPSGPGMTHVRSGEGPMLLSKAPKWKYGTVQAEIRFPNDFGDDAGLLVRVSNARPGADNFDGYEISLSAKNRTLLLGKHEHDFHPLVSTPAPIKPGEWHLLRVRLGGGAIQVFLDAEKLPRIDYTDPNPIDAGSFALRAWHADVDFRNVRCNGKACPVRLTGEGVSRWWDRVSTGSAQGRFDLEEGGVNGQLCQRIQFLGGKGEMGVANRGLNRWGIAIRRGHPMEGHLWLKGNTGSAWVSLQSADGVHVYARGRVNAASGWSRRAFRLTPSKSDPNARFVVSSDRPGSLWVDQAVLMDAAQDRYKGLPVRRDIAEALIASGQKFMRYGGSMVNVPDYRWKNMIGDPDRRPPYAGDWHSCTTNGFGIFDFLTFCEKSGMHSAFAINSYETPQDAADLADYLTAPPTNPWGKKRGQDGHPAPYHPDYIEIGNEEAIGNPDPLAMAQYARRFASIAAAIHGRNPSLKLVCAAWWIPGSASMKTAFEAADGQAAAWDLHFWSDNLDAGTSIERELSRAESSFKTWNPATGLKAVVFEENGNRHDMQRALGHALTVNAARRHGDFVLADSAANALQPLGQNDNGWDQGGVFFTPDKAWLMPPDVAQQLLSRDDLPLRVFSSADGGMDILATRSTDGRTVDLTLVNPAVTSADCSVSLARISRAQGWTMSGELTVVAGVDIGMLAVQVGRDGARVSLAPHSISLLRFRLKGK